MLYTDLVKLIQLLKIDMIFPFDQYRVIHSYSLSRYLRHVGVIRLLKSGQNRYNAVPHLSMMNPANAVTNQPYLLTPLE